MDAIHTENYKGYTIEICLDDNPVSPREWDNAGTIACWHSHYDLGDEQPKVSPSEWRESLPKDLIVLPVFLYDHSWITISTHGDRYPFNDQWDAGQVGYIYITKEKAIHEWGKKKCTASVIEQAKKCLESEIDTYNDYLIGNVFGYRVLNGDGECIESCWDYYPSPDDNPSYKCCLDEARSVADCLEPLTK